MKHVFNIFIVGILLIVHTLQAQSKLDSLAHVVGKTTDKKVALKLYTILAREYLIKGDVPNFKRYKVQMSQLAYELQDQETVHLALYYEAKAEEFEGNKAKMYEILEKVEQYAEEKKSFLLQSYVYRSKSVSTSIEGDYQKAIYYTEKVLAMPNQDDRTLANAWGFLASIYIQMGEYQKAITCLHKAHPYVQKINVPTSTILFNQQMGNIYKSLAEYSKSRSYFEHSLQIALQIQDKVQEADTWGNIAATYLKEKNYPKALETLEKSLALDRQMGRYASLQTNLTNLGNIYVEQKKFSEALQALEEAKSMAIKNKDNETIASINVNIALVYAQTNKDQEAITLLLETKKDCYKLGKRGDLLSVYDALSFSYGKVGKADLAYEAHKSMLALRDSLHNEKSVQQVNELQTKYEVAQKENAIALLSKNNRIKDLELSQLMNEKNRQEQIARLLDIEQENEINELKISELEKKNENIQKAQKISNLAKENQAKDFDLQRKNLALQNKNLEVQRQYLLIFGLLALAVILGAVGYLFYSRKGLQLQNKAMVLEQKMLRSQLNPHFIFNSLATIQTYLFENEPQKTAMYLAKFSKLMRQVLENSREDFVPLDKEIQTLENYLQLQQMRFGKKLAYSIEVSSAIDTEAIEIPPMFAQPFIENSIEHGLLHKAGEGIIQINFSLDKNVVVLEVKDNGVGLEQAKTLRSEIKKEHKSLATQITQERLSLLRQKYQMPLDFILQELKTQLDEVAGTQVRVELPYQG
jgi:tetratricopeptide (TPR) repeat protein